MSSAGVIWIALAVAVVVFLDLLFVELRRCVREAKRIGARLEGYGDLPVFALLATTARDVDRTNAAFDAIPLLVERGRAAIAVIRAPFGRSS